MGKLTTHVLDTANGRPAAGMAIELSVLEGGAWKKLASVRTNADGRTDRPLLEGAALALGHPAPHAEVRPRVERVGEAFEAHRAGDAHAARLPLRRSLDEQGVRCHPARPAR